jgi:hypothetical protein
MLMLLCQAHCSLHIDTLALHLPPDLRTTLSYAPGLEVCSDYHSVCGALVLVRLRASGHGVQAPELDAL